MKQALRIALPTVLLLISCSISAKVSGAVFRDFNDNGVKNNTTTCNGYFVTGKTAYSPNFPCSTSKSLYSASYYYFTNNGRVLSSSVFYPTVKSF